MFDAARSLDTVEADMEDATPGGPTFDPTNALAMYGSLLPGEVNHHAVKAMEGEWVDGYILGYTFDVTWGGAEGHPGFIPDPEGFEVPVSVLIYDKWSSHWDRLDKFEGPGYRRIEIDVYDQQTREIAGRAQVYECLTDND